jgi:hypothetical protein
MGKREGEWIRRRGGGKGREKKKRKKRKKEKGKGEKKKNERAIYTFHNLNPLGEAVLPNLFQNGFSSIKKAAPPEEPEPETFLEESEPCQTGPKLENT